MTGSPSQAADPLSCTHEGNRDPMGLPIRIAMIHSFYSSARPSGENTVVLNEVDALRRAGHEVALFAAHTDELEGEILYALRAGLRVATGYGRNPMKAIKAFSPDVVHIHNLFPNFGENWVAQVTVPLVVTVHNYRPLCAKGTLYRDGNVCRLCIDHGPTRALRYGCYRASVAKTVPLVASQLGRTTARTLLRSVSQILVPSDKQRKIYVEAGIPPDRVRVYPNFIPEALAPQVPTVREERHGWLFVGRLSDEKGILELLRSWPRGRALTIIGDGELRHEVERLSGGRVRFWGMLERSQVVSEMARSVGLLFPSRAYETFGLPYAEALAVGTGTVAFRPNVVSDTVESDGTGVAATWDGSLETYLDRMCNDEESVSLRQQVFSRNYSERAYVSRARELYEGLQTQ